MADDNTISGAGSSGAIANALAEAQGTATGTDKPKKSDELGQAEFLNLLVEQLKNQDPLNPMDPQAFSSQLAQFSQLERLISIDKKLGDGGLNGANPISSMASYLGNEVVIKDKGMQVEGGKGSNLLVNVPEGTQSVRVDLIDASGAVVGRHTLDDVKGGRQVLPLEGLDVPDGPYDVRVVSVDSEGKFVDLPSKVTGTVEGFVLEPEPMLLVGGEEVALDEVTEVHTGVKS